MKAKVTTSKGPMFTSVNIPAIIKPIAEKWAAVALADVQAQWPVDSGKSKAGWETRVVITGNTVKIILTNPVPYAKYVSARGSKTDIATPLADSAILKIQTPMNAEIASRIAEAMRRSA